MQEMIDALQARVDALGSDLGAVKSRQNWLIAIGILGLAVNIAFQASRLQSAAQGATVGTQSITLGATATTPSAAPQRDWLTTGEVSAARDGREFRIPANYSRPLTADTDRQ